MNINPVMEPEIRTDAALVESSLAGDREAFGLIVARYQSPICALAYSACGNVARSQDLAQDIFITAWRKLGTLEEPARFKAWLYGIARHLIHNAFRRQTRNPVAGADSFDDTAEPASPAGEPDAQAISKEEEVILWHVLAGLPEIYREPMVLFYRQNESIPQVAEILAISEEATRQRLSRGRVLLNERVTNVIQNGLRRTGPGDTFALGVVAALPFLAAATTTKDAIVGMAATKSASGKATGMVAVLKGIGFFAGIIAVPAMIGTYLGNKLWQDAGGSPQQRRSAAKFWRVFGWGIVLFLFLPLLLVFGLTGFLPGSARAGFLSVMTIWLGLAYPFVLGSLVFWVWLRCRKQPAADSAVEEVEPAVQPAETFFTLIPRRISRRLILLLTVAAASLLVFCYLDMGRSHVLDLKPGEFQSLINQNPPADLTVSLWVSHYHSLLTGSAGVIRTFLAEVQKDGKTTRYWVPADDTTVALLAQKGIACPTYVQGRDFEVLGTPGRFLPFLAAFVLALGAIFLLRRRPAPGSSPAAK